MTSTSFLNQTRQGRLLLRCDKKMVGKDRIPCCVEIFPRPGLLESQNRGFST
jgi:hypothetical protein